MASNGDDRVTLHSLWATGNTLSINRKLTCSLSRREEWRTKYEQVVNFLQAHKESSQVVPWLLTWCTTCVDPGSTQQLTAYMTHQASFSPLMSVITKMRKDVQFINALFKRWPVTLQQLCLLAVSWWLMPWVLVPVTWTRPKVTPGDTNSPDQFLWVDRVTYFVWVVLAQGLTLGSVKFSAKATVLSEAPPRRNQFPNLCSWWQNSSPWHIPVDQKPQFFLNSWHKVGSSYMELLLYSSLLCQCVPTKVAVDVQQIKC